MARQAYTSTSAPAGRARRSSVAMMAVFSVASISLLGAGSNTVERSAAHATPTFTRLIDVPSHNDRYRASLIPSTMPPRLGRALGWTLVVATAAGAPVDHASMALESWRPNDNRLGPRTRVTGDLGGGQYRVEGLRFDRPGWWNVRLRISAAGGTDSLAFNLVF